MLAANVETCLIMFCFLHHSKHIIETVGGSQCGTKSDPRDQGQISEYSLDDHMSDIIPEILMGTGVVPNLGTKTEHKKWGQNCEYPLCGSHL